MSPEVFYKKNDTEKAVTEPCKGSELPMMTTTSLKSNELNLTSKFLMSQQATPFQTPPPSISYSTSSATPEHSTTFQASEPPSSPIQPPDLFKDDENHLVIDESWIPPAPEPEAADVVYTSAPKSLGTPVYTTPKDTKSARKAPDMTRKTLKVSMKAPEDWSDDGSIHSEWSEDEGGW